MNKNLKTKKTKNTSPNTLEYEKDKEISKNSKNSGKNQQANYQNNPIAQNLPLGSLPLKPIVRPLSIAKPMMDRTLATPADPIQEKYDDDELVVDKPISDQKMEEEKNPTEISDKIHLTLKLKTKNLQINSASAQTFPMIASLSVDDLKVNNRANIDLICVIDISGSMAGEKLKLLLETLKYLLTLLSDNDRLCLITFNHEAKRLSRLIRMTKNGKNDILMTLQNMMATGNTDIAAGMEKAFRVIKDRQTRNAVTGIFLLSDGIDNGAEVKVKKLLEELVLEENFAINCFGYGQDHSPDLMNKIAEFKDGTFFYIEKYDQLDGYFVDCLGGLISVVAEDLKLQIKAEPSEIFPDIKILNSFRSQSTFAEDLENKVFTTRLEHAISGKQRDFVFLLQIPRVTGSLLDHEKNIVIASAKCEMKLSVTGSKNILVKNTELSVMVHNEDEEFKEEVPDKDVMVNYYRLRATDISAEARGLADQRKYQEAKKIVTDFKEELSNSQFKQETLVVKLIEHFGTMLEGIAPERYQGHSRHSMVEKESMFKAQKSHPTYNMYSNQVQLQMQRIHMSHKGMD